MNVVKSSQKLPIAKTAVYRTVWLLVTTAVVALVVVATPLRYRMLQSDIYGYEDGLTALGLSLDFFAAYFVSWELVVVGGSILVAGLIVWQRANDWFAMLVALGLSLFGLVPPLIDGLHFANSQWAIPVSILRLFIMGVLMAIFCLFPNGRFQPGWTRWLLIAWVIFSIGVLLINPLMLMDTAVLPNTRNLQDAIWLLIGVAWFSAALVGQAVRYRRYASPIEKQQMKIVLFGFVTVVGFSLLSAVLLIRYPDIHADPANRVRFTLVMGALYLLAAVAIPIDIALSILRFRLWDIDIILNRSLVYGGLTGLVTAVYVLLVGGVGILAAGTQSRLGATVVATLVVLIGIRPLQQRLQTVVDQLVPRQQPVQKQSHPLQREPATPSLLLRLVQLGWVFNLLLVFTLFIIGFSTIFGQGFKNVGATISQLEIDAVFPEFLIDRAQITPVMSIQMLIQVAIFVLIGLFIAWQKPNNLIALLTSSMLLNVGLGFTPNLLFLPFLHPQMTAPYIVWNVLLYWNGMLVLYLFPNGRLTSPRARWLLGLSLGYIALWLPFSHLTSGLATVWWPTVAIVVLTFVAIGNQAVRYRQSPPREKAQIKWIIIGFSFANIGLMLLIMQPFLFDAPTDATIYSLFHFFTLLFGLMAVFIPISILIAVLRHDLWNVDFIINRTLVYGGLTAVILLTYALLVGGFSLLWQSQNNLVISLFATGLIAVLFQPVRERLQRAANRLMFGERDDPYRVLSKLGSHLQANATPEAMLQSVVATIATTLKLPYVAIELQSEQGRLQNASTGKAVAETVDFPLRYQNEMVGYLVVSPRSPGEPFSERERQLLTDIAGQTGTAAYSVRLTTALQRSREKLVLTREEERRRIRRDLHDELGPTLASQTFALDTAIDLLETNPVAAANVLKSLKLQNQETVADIRRLVYELRPPSLDELGLLGALEAYVGQLNGRSLPSITITVQPNPLPPLSAAIEVAAYRIALEAISNVVRHAKATRCDLSLEILASSKQMLRLVIIDNGVGLPKGPRSGIGHQSMRERAEELGGRLTIMNLVQGVQITAELPLTS